MTALIAPIDASLSDEEVLGTSVSLGGLTLSSRLVISPHTVNFGFTDGSPDDDFIAYMTRRAPGFGLTWVPIAAPDPLGRAEPEQPWLWDDRFIPGSPAWRTPSEPRAPSRASRSTMPAARRALR